MMGSAALSHFRYTTVKRLTVERADGAEGGGAAAVTVRMGPLPPSIPRIFHRIWLGGPMPAKFARYGQTFERLHPDWEMRLWTEENVPRLRNQEAFDRATSPAQKADILRYELLFEHGGVYVDTDFECKKRLDPLLRSVSAFSASEDSQWVSIGIMGATPRHPLFEAVIEELPRSVASQPEAAVNVQTGPLLFTRVVTARKLRRLDPDFVVFSRELFYPYGPTETSRRNEPFPEAYAVHHWAGSWLGDSPRSALASGTAAGIERAVQAPSVAEPGAGPSATPSDGRLRLLIGFDPEVPTAGLSLLVAYRELFAPDDLVELGVYAYAEPSLPLLECVQQLVRVLLGDPAKMAPLCLYSRAELSTVPYAAAFFPTGNEVNDATNMARAHSALHAFRERVDHDRGRSAGRSLPAAPRRAELLEQASQRPGKRANVLPGARSNTPAPMAAVQPPPRLPSAFPTAPASIGLCGTALGNGRMLVRTSSGFPLLCSAEDLSLTPELLLRGEYDRPLTRFLETRLAPGQVAFDVGANIGLFSVVMARAVGSGGRVIAYEALPTNFSLLRDNVSMNYVAERCTLLEHAAWSSERELTFHAPSRFLGNGSFCTDLADYSRRYPGDTLRAIRVKAKPLSAELERFSSVSVVKIDVEGGEHQVLLGMRQAIESGRVQTVVFECLRRLLGEDFSPLVQLLHSWERELGLRCHTLDPEGRLRRLTLEVLEREGNFTQVLLERP